MNLLFRFIIDFATFFGIYMIISLALNFQYGNAGIPNMGCAVSVACGGYVVSAITLRITYWIAQQAGIEIGSDWVYDNPVNVMHLNSYFQNHLLIGISLFFVTLVLAFMIGAVVGYFISLPAIRLKALHLMITLMATADASQIIGKNYVPISGGTLGVFIPNLFESYTGDRSLLLALISLTIGSFCFFLIRSILKSPYGRLMRALRENEVTVRSVGKNTTVIKRNIFMFSSGITAIAGVLVTFFFSYANADQYTRASFTYLPWLMLLLGGMGNNTGTVIGTFFIISMRRLIITYKWLLADFLWFPPAFLEQTIFGILLLIIILFRPYGLMPEGRLRLRGIKYSNFRKNARNGS